MFVLAVLLVAWLAGRPSLMEGLDSPEVEEEREGVRVVCNLTTVTSQPSWQPVQVVLDEGRARWLLPFLVQWGREGEPPFILLLRGELQVRLEIRSNRATLQDTDQEEPSESGLVPGLLREGEDRGFWMKVKVSVGKTVVSLNPAGDLNWKDSLVELELKGEHQPTSWEYAFLVAGGSTSLARGCRAPLGGSCSHSRECVEQGAACKGSGGPGVGECVCGNDYKRRGEGCVGNRRNLGESCTSSRQCWTAAGRCTRGSCTCPSNMRQGSKGVCVALPAPGPWDQVALAIARPLRLAPLPEAAGLEGREGHGGSLGHCSLRALLPQEENFAVAPLIWGRTGFLVAGFLKSGGSGSSLAISLFRGGHTQLGQGSGVMVVELGEEIVSLQEEGARTRQLALGPGGGQWPGGQWGWFYVQYRSATAHSTF